jgi:protein-disulfide isomerase
VSVSRPSARAAPSDRPDPIPWPSAAALRETTDPRVATLVIMQGVNRRILIAVVGAAVVAAAALIALSVSGGGDSSTPATTAAPEPGLLAGIPQHGTVLGKPSGTATVYEFADLQCPFCADFARDALPSVVREYVRTGRIKLDFRPLEFLGADSDRGARAVLAAAKQNRAWNMIEGLYAAQGAENSGWLTEGLVREIGGEIGGLDAERMVKDMTGVSSGLQKAADQANRLGVQGTPSFYLLLPLGQPKELQLGSLSAEGFRAALDPLLA